MFLHLPKLSLFFSLFPLTPFYPIQVKKEGRNGMIKSNKILMEILTEGGGPSELAGMKEQA